MFLKALPNKKNKHTHIVYVQTDADGNPVSGQSTKDKGHFHPLVIEAASAMMLGPDGLPVANVQQGPNVYLGEADGHTHELGELEIKSKDRFKISTKSEDKAERIRECHRLRKKALEFDGKSRQEARDDEKYYENSQWKKDDFECMEDTNRPAITANITHSTMLSLFGYQRNNRTMLKYYPVEGGDQVISDVMEVVTKLIFQKNNFYQEESEVFERAAVGGLDFFNAYIDYNENLNGEVIVEEIHRDNVLLGPHLKKDLKDCEYLIKETMCSYDKLSKMFPKQAKELKHLVNRLDAVNQDEQIKGESGTEIDPIVGGRLYKEIYTAGEVAELYDKKAKNMKLCECWEKVYFQTYSMIDVQTLDDPISLTDWEEDDIDSLKTLDGVKIIGRVETFMRITKFVLDLWLDDEYPELALQDFHVVPLYAEKRKNGFAGKVRYNKSLQDSINKYLSVFADILNKMNGRGWFYDEDTFNDETDAEKFVADQDKPGFVSKVRDVTKPPLKSDGATYPAEMERAIQMITSLFDRIMNVNTDFLGIKTSAESGLAQARREKQALIGNEYLFDNFSLAKRKLGKLIVHMIQEVYTPPRLIRILQNQHARSPLKLAGVPFDQYDPATLEEMLNDADLTKYDVFIEDAPDSPSTMVANFYVLADLAGKGVPIPPEILVEMAPNIPETKKARILEAISQQRQSQQQAEQAKQESEVQKAQEAKEGRVQTELIRQRGKIEQTQAQNAMSGALGRG